MFPPLNAPVKTFLNPSRLHTRRSSQILRVDALMKLAAVAAMAALPVAGWSQTMPASSAPATMPTLIVAPATAPEPTPVTTAPGLLSNAGAGAVSAAPTPTPATAPAGDIAPVTQAFVATITSDKVYVRSGPGTAYYEMGQLGKGDLVYVVGSSRGWYEILPPNKTFCLIAKELVDVDTTAGTATVNKDYVNLRAGTAVNKNRDPSAVLTVVRKGTKLKIISTGGGAAGAGGGGNDKYVEVAPTDRSFVYISPQFVKASPGTAYSVPDLKLPAGATGPSVTTVEAPTTPPVVSGEPVRPTIIMPLPTENGGAATPGTVADGGSTVITGGHATGGEAGVVTSTIVPLPKPKVTYSETATAKFRDANARYQEEAKKPPAQQNPDAFSQEFKDILAMENISPSVKAGAQADLAAIDRTLTVQRLIKEQAASEEMTKKQSDALRQQYEEAEKAIAAAREAGPYSAEGVLQTSTIVQGKYALVNPQTGRTVAYVDPAAAAVDIGSLVGKYIGVRGMSKKMEGSDITVIQVSNATLMPQPATMAK